MAGWVAGGEDAAAVGDGVAGWVAGGELVGAVDVAGARAVVGAPARVAGSPAGVAGGSAALVRGHSATSNAAVWTALPKARICTWAVMRRVYGVGSPRPVKKP